MTISSAVGPTGKPSAISLALAAARAAVEGASRDATSSAYATARSTHETNEEEDELGVARSSKYHAIKLPRASSPDKRTGATSLVAAAGGSMEVDDEYMEIGPIDSLPFQSAVPSSVLAARHSSQRPAVDDAIGDHEVRNEEKAADLFAFHSSHQRSSSSAAASDSAAATGPAATPATPSSPTPSAARASTAVGVSSGFISASAALAAAAANAPPQPSKPYVRYVPKFNTQFGASAEEERRRTMLRTPPIQHAMEQKEASRAEEQGEEEKQLAVIGEDANMSAGEGGGSSLSPSSSDHSSPTSSDASASARIRSSTVFDLGSGHLSAHVAIKIPVEDAANMSVPNSTGQKSSRWGGSTTTSVIGSAAQTGRRSTGVASPVISPAGSKKRGSIASMHSSTLGSSASTSTVASAAVTARRHTGGSQTGGGGGGIGSNVVSARFAGSDFASDAEGDGEDVDEDGEGGTFITGLNLSDGQRQQQQQSMHEQRIRLYSSCSSPEINQTMDALNRAIEQAPHAPNRDTVHNLNQVQGVESAVGLLPELLRPTKQALRDVYSVYMEDAFAAQAQAMAIRSADGRSSVTKTVRVPLPVVPALDMPARVNLPELMGLALNSLNLPRDALAIDETGREHGSSTSMLSQALRSLPHSQFKAYFHSPESMRIIKDAFYFVLLYFFGSTEPARRAPISPSSHSRKLRRVLSDYAGDGAASPSPPSSPSPSTSPTRSNSKQTTKHNKHHDHHHHHHGRRRPSYRAGGDEMYRYRDYAANLKKYQEQEGYARKYAEWIEECQRIKREKEEQAQDKIAAAGGATNGGTTANNNNSNNSAPPPSSSPKTPIVYPAPPSQTSTAKRAPLVMLVDIPQFDVGARLNTGPVPKEVFDVKWEEAEMDEAGKGRRRRQQRFPHLPKPCAPSSTSGVPSYSSPGFILTALKSRISTSFVRFFLKIAPQHKDFFYTHYYDVLAQSMYYSLLIAYPHSRSLLNHSFFKTRLLQLMAYWVQGYVPAREALEQTMSHWAGDMQLLTGNVGVDPRWVKEKKNHMHAQQNNTNMNANNDNATETSTTNVETSRRDPSNYDEYDSDEEEEVGMGGLSTETSLGVEWTMARNNRFLQSLATSSPTGPAYLAALERKLNMQLASGSAGTMLLKTARSSRHGTLSAVNSPTAASASTNPSSPTAQPSVHFAGLNSPISTSSISALSPNSRPNSSGGGGGGSRMRLSFASPRSDRSSTTTGPSSSSPPLLLSSSAAVDSNMNSMQSQSLTGDLLVDVGAKAPPVRASSRIPLKVSRRRVDLHHSALIQAFIDARNFGAQSRSLNIRIPISIPNSHGSVEGADESSGQSGILSAADGGVVLDELATLNAAHATTTEALRASYADSKHEAARAARRSKKELAAVAAKVEQERARALRDAQAFSKNLVADHQERQYGEVKAPSKSLALRRLGHFRQTKEEGSSTVALTQSTQKSPATAALLKL